MVMLKYACVNIVLTTTAEDEKYKRGERGMVGERRGCLRLANLIAGEREGGGGWGKRWGREYEQGERGTSPSAWRTARERINKTVRAAAKQPSGRSAGSFGRSDRLRVVVFVECGLIVVVRPVFARPAWLRIRPRIHRQRPQREWPLGRR